MPRATPKDGGGLGKHPNRDHWASAVHGNNVAPYLKFGAPVIVDDTLAVRG